MTGQLNRYDCTRCHRSIVTIDRAEGVTPMMIACRFGCDGSMRSAFYRNVFGGPSYEWRKPTSQEYHRLSGAMQEHVDMGGLNLYPIDGAMQEVCSTIETLSKPARELFGIRLPYRKPPRPVPDQHDQAAIAAAEARRERKCAKNKKLSR